MTQKHPSGDPIQEELAQQWTPRPTEPGGDGQPDYRDSPAIGEDSPPAAPDPKNPASKPQGTTQDQIANMENEGQAQEPSKPEDQASAAHQLSAMNVLVLTGAAFVEFS